MPGLGVVHVTQIVGIALHLRVTLWTLNDSAFSQDDSQSLRIGYEESRGKP